MGKVINTRDTRDLGAFIPSALDDACLTSNEFRVYCRLARRAGGGMAFESVLNMALGCLVSERTIQRCLRSLEERQLIRSEPQPGGTTHYFLLPLSGGCHTVTPVTGAGEGCQKRPGGGVTQSPKGSPLKVQTEGVPDSSTTLLGEPDPTRRFGRYLPKTGDA